MNDIGNKIKELRTLMNLSLQDLAKLVNVSKAAIQQYENGSTKPSNLVLKSIASALAVNVWDFYRIPKYSLDVNSIRFRDGHTLFDANKEADVIKKDVINFIENYIELETISGNNIDFENPIDDMVISNYNDVERAAKKVRKKWKLGNSPIDSVCSLIESKGIKIITINRTTGSGGLSAWVNSVPVIILNDYFEHTRETTRRRFTIVHELAHILMRLGENVDKEQEEYFCNRFAAAFLLIDEVAHSYFGKDRTSISLGELNEIKLTYGISIRSIIYRMNSLKLIDDGIKDRIISEYEIWRIDRKDFGEYIKSDEKPKRFFELLRTALAEDRIEKYKASELSGIPIDKLKELTIKNFNLN